jgi:hypothetical protein
MEPIVVGRSISIGRARFEWMESGAFLVQRSDAEIPSDAPPEWQANSPLPPQPASSASTTPSVARESAGILELELDACVTVQRDDDGHAIV